jgi:hypothetical protein
MKGSVGDRIVVVSSQVGGTVRDGRIVEVRGEDGGPPYLVEWSENGHRGLYFPGPDGFIQHPDDESAPPPAPARVKTWRVDVQLFEQGPNTSARAVLHAEAPQTLEGHGAAHRNPTDFDVPEIGDEVAAARALRQLADVLLSTAASDIGEIEHHDVSLKG